MLVNAFLYQGELLLRLTPHPSCGRRVLEITHSFLKIDFSVYVGRELIGDGHQETENEREHKETGKERTQEIKRKAGDRKQVMCPRQAARGANVL